MFEHVDDVCNSCEQHQMSSRLSAKEFAKCVQMSVSAKVFDNTSTFIIYTNILPNLWQVTL